MTTVFLENVESNVFRQVRLWFFRIFYSIWWSLRIIISTLFCFINQTCNSFTVIYIISGPTLNVPLRPIHFFILFSTHFQLRQKQLRISDVPKTSTTIFLTRFYQIFKCIIPELHTMQTFSCSQNEITLNWNPKTYHTTWFFSALKPEPIHIIDIHAPKLPVSLSCSSNHPEHPISPIFQAPLFV